MKPPHHTKFLLLPIIAAWFFPGSVLAETPAPSAENVQLQSRIDWPKYLKRLDPVSETLPAKFDEGTSVGNGMLGLTFYRDGTENRLRFDIGRGDVTDHRPQYFSNEVGRGRLPIGYFTLTPAGRILDGEARIDIWNAETRGSVLTDRGRITFRAFCHAKENVMVVDVATEGGEQDARLEWHPAEAKPDGVAVPDGYEPNPPLETKIIEAGLTVSHQKLLVGGDYATAIQEISPRHGAKRYFISICNFVADSAPAEAAAKNVGEAAAKPYEDWLASHRAWWHEYYPASFISIPDIRIESFYWMQLYRLASATRADGMPIDTSGPWLRTTMWPMWWWDYNIQTAYYPVYAANQLHLGESLTRLMDKNMENFILNVPERYRHDSAGINGHSGLNCRCDIDQSFEYNMVGCLPYACHNYWLQYRYSMDPEMLKRLFPLLKRSINFYRHLLEERDDGKLHLPATMSPEYGVTRNANFDLALLRWGCERLIETCAKLGIDDPLIPEWKKILERLVDYPRDENGYRIGEDIPVLASHRHSSHIFNIYPLYLVNWDQPENREVIAKSVDHWINVGKGPGLEAIEAFSAKLPPPIRIMHFGGLGYLSPWSWAAASSMYASFDDGDKALFYLDKYLSHPGIFPNTQYVEGFPVIESGFVGAKAVQDMMLQSWGGKLRVFRGLPPTWKDAVFHNLRGEGAFLVSAERREGKLRWLSIKSEAGEPCILSAPLADGFTCQSSDPKVSCRRLPDGDIEIQLPKGSEVFLFNAGEPHTAVVQPLPVSGSNNPWGVKKTDDAGATLFPVRDFGAVPDDGNADGEAIRKCIAAAQASGKPAEVLFEAGIYQVELEGGGADDWALPVKGAEKLMLHGAEGGSTLVFTNPSVGGILFENCTDVSIRNLTIDYDPLPYSFGTVTAVDEQSGTFDLELDEASITFDHSAYSKENAKALWGIAVQPDAKYQTTRYGPHVIGGGVAGHDGIHHMVRGFVPCGCGMGARRVVPVHGGVRKIRHRIAAQRVVEKLKVAVAAPIVIRSGKGFLIQRAVVDPCVSGQAIKREVLANTRPVCWSSAARQVRLAPEDGIEVQAGMARRLHLRPEAVEPAARTLDRAEAIQEDRHVINRKVGFPLDLPIARVREILFHHPVGDGFPGRLVDGARIEQLAGIGRVVALDVIPIVVRPHDREAEPVVVGSLEESPVQRAFKIRAVVVMIPIEDERFEPMVCGRIDLAGHHQGIRFILVAPERNLGLQLTGKTRPGAADQIPLGETRILGLVPTRMRMRAGIVVGRDGYVGQRWSIHFCFSQMTHF